MVPATSYQKVCYMAITKTPFVQVTINRHGFNVLDVRFNVVGTEKTQQHVIMLISSVTGRDASDDNDWISSWYDHVMDAYKSKKETSSESFYIEDDLISIRRYDEVTGV